MDFEFNKFILVLSKSDLEIFLKFVFIIRKLKIF